MKDLKSDFRDWLSKQAYSKNTIDQYVYRIDKICHKLYNYKEWELFTEDGFYLLAQYTEYANKEYYVDFVTIEYALNYFETFFNTLSKSNTIKNLNNNNVELYLYTNKSDYFIDKVNFNDLYDYLCILNTSIYHKPQRQIKLNGTQIYSFVDNIYLTLDKNTIKPNTKLAIHVVYKENINKTALSKYCSFLQATNSGNIYMNTMVAFVENIKENNPNKTVDGHYQIVQPISGKLPLKIKAINEQERLDINFTITKTDLTKIFDLDKDTVTQILKRSKYKTNQTIKYSDEDILFSKRFIEYMKDSYNISDKIIEYETELRTYYNAENINCYLEKHHHYHDNNRMGNIDYTKEGYKFWCNRKEALDILHIGKSAFYTNSYNLTKIDYTDYTTKYYKPELKCMEKRPHIKRIQRRVNSVKSNK